MFDSFDSFVDRGVRRARDALRSGDRSAALSALTEGTRTIEGEGPSLLRVGLDDEAMHRLDLWLEPKWPSAAACAEAYEQAMGARS